MTVYAILAEGKLLPNYFNTYKKVLDEVKKVYPDWDHHIYTQTCNEIGRKSIIIRYNPDIVRNKGKMLDIKQEDRIGLLVKSIKEELVKEYDKFIVKIIQLYFDDNYEEYKYIKEEEITNIVCI